MHERKHLFSLGHAVGEEFVNVLAIDSSLAILLRILCRCGFVNEAVGERDYHGASGVDHTAHSFVEGDFACTAFWRVETAPTEFGGHILIHLVGVCHNLVAVVLSAERSDLVSHTGELQIWSELCVHVVAHGASEVNRTLPTLGDACVHEVEHHHIAC